MVGHYYTMLSIVLTGYCMSQCSNILKSGANPALLNPFFNKQTEQCTLLLPWVDPVYNPTRGLSVENVFLAQWGQSPYMRIWGRDLPTDSVNEILLFSRRLHAVDGWGPVKNLWDAGEMLEFCTVFMAVPLIWIRSVPLTPVLLCEYTYK